MPPFPSIALLAALFLILLYALNDRFAGGGSPELDEKLPFRGFVWGLIPCAGVGYLASGWPLAVMAVIWGLYRCLPWRIGGSTTPRGAGQLVAAFLRHAMPAGAAVAFAINEVGGFNWWALAAFLGLYAIGATALAASYTSYIAQLVRRRAIDDGSFNARVELMRGGMFGAALASWVGLASINALVG